MASMANRLLDQLLWWLRFEYIRGIDDHSTSEYIRLFKQVRDVARLRLRLPSAARGTGVSICDVIIMAYQTLDLETNRCRCTVK